MFTTTSLPFSSSACILEQKWQVEVAFWAKLIWLGEAAWKILRRIERPHLSLVEKCGDTWVTFPRRVTERSGGASLCPSCVSHLCCQKGPTVGEDRVYQVIVLKWTWVTTHSVYFSSIFTFLSPLTKDKGAECSCYWKRKIEIYTNFGSVFAFHLERRRQYI